MKKRKRFEEGPADEDRRRIIQGGLLTAATALGFLPSCGDAAEAGAPNPASAAGPGGASAAGNGNLAQAGTPASGSGGMIANASAAGRAGGAAGQSRAGSNASGAPTAGSGNGGSSATAGTPGGTAGAAAGSGGVGSGMATLPRAMLGKTGVMVPIIGLGTSRLGQRGGTPNAADFDNMVEVFSGVLDLGIEYVDTGANYGRAEEALGQVLKGRRDKVFLVTKLYTDTYSQARQLFERSLERLQTDHVDLLHLHSVGERNIDTVLSQNGSWRYILEQKMMGRTRFVGITGHSNPANFTRMLATNEVDVLMTIMNFVDHSTYGFSKLVREDAVSRGVGVMAMKVFGGTESVLRPGGGLANSDAPEPHPSNMEISFDQSVLPDCMRFVKSLGGITGMVIGINDLDEVKRNIQWAIETQPFSDTEMQAIVKMGESVAPMWAQRYG